jgi:hypothetical protein
MAGILLFAASSCKKDYTDPSGPSTGNAFNTANALTDVAVGLQNWYTANRTGNVYTKIAAASLLTGETYVVNAGNTDENQLYLGGTNVQNTNTIVTGLWTVSNKIIFDANNVLSHVDAVVADKSYASGLIAYTSIWKALAIGDMAEFWEQIPDTTGTNVTFITNTAGYTKAIAIIDNALAAISANAVSSTFTKNIPAGIDLQNTLYALKARYALFAGDYTTALAAANAVTLSTTSTYNYNALTTNPIFTLVTSTNNIYQVTDSTMSLPVGFRPDTDDKRYPFYVTISSSPRFRIKGFYNAVSQAIPVYLPGEITLIKAECYARQHDVVNGLIELNKVVTKTASQDAFGVGAALPPVVAATESELLDLIYKHRRIELFMGGLALEDERRFDRPATERKRSYFPYPFVERNDNTNTPTDPSF